MVRKSVLILEGKKKKTKKEEKRHFSFLTGGGSLGGNGFSHFLTRKRQERGLLFWKLPFLERFCF